jgi:hypothetical protein
MDEWPFSCIIHSGLSALSNFCQKNGWQAFCAYGMLGADGKQSLLDKK